MGTSELSSRTCFLLKLTHLFTSLAWFGYRHPFASALLPLYAGRVVSSSCSKHTGEECVGPQDCLQAYCRVLSKGLKSSISSNFRRKVLETWWWPAEVCNRT
eukprot:586933-Pelagomonas_calceolata.AAC.1